MMLHLTVIFIYLVTLMVVIPAGACYLLYNKYGNVMPGKVAVVAWASLIFYVWFIFTLAPKAIPDSWKLQSSQQMVCEMKTVYTHN